MSRHKQLFPGPFEKPSWAGLKARSLDGGGIEVGGTLSLSNPIVSVEDGPRIMAKVSNFGGKKAAPFRKGGKRRAKVLVAKAAVKKAKMG